MIKKYFLLPLMLLGLSSGAFAQHYPFPQHTAYKTHIKPDNYTQEQLDNQVKAFYDAWKAKYLINGCEDNQYYVFFDDGNTVTVSEAMGYGMLIVPLMAGYDPDARMIFNGLFRYYKAHPSHVTPHLMAWKQITGCIDAGGPDSASDGDIDIAFGLLLAHAQWGTQGTINYFQEALLIIHDLMGESPAEGDINQDYYSVKLGDWVDGGSYMTGTRTSDFIMDHFRAFACAINDTSWNQVTDECYTLIDTMQTDYSPETGLLPDFIVNIDETPEPAPADYLEGELDGNYSYNACRDPWRIATDYLINGDERAKAAVLKINQWLIESAEGSANNVYAGYYLDGTHAVGWSDIAFTAPFAVGAMVDTANQEWLNRLYAKILSANIANGGYYDNTLKMLALITLSGNYWVPSCDILNGMSELNTDRPQPLQVYPTITSGRVQVKIDKRYSEKPIKISVFNTSGARLTNSPLTSSVIDSSKYPAGMYLISVSTEKGQILGTGKVFKQ